MREVIHAKDGAAPGGHYSHAIAASGKFVFVSGQGPTVPSTGEVLDGDVARETRQTLDNVKAILESAGASLDDVVKVNVYLRDINDFNTMNEVYKTVFANNPPARTTIGCAIKISVEIDCVAVVDR